MVEPVLPESGFATVSPITGSYDTRRVMNFDTRTTITRHPLAGRTTTDEYWLTIPNPDDASLMPIYDGTPREAHRVLRPGRYEGIIENLDRETSGTLTVYVAKNFTVLGRFVLVAS